MYLLHMNAEACKQQEFVNFYLMTLLVMLLHMKTCPDMDVVAVMGGHENGWTASLTKAEGNWIMQSMIDAKI